MAAKKATPKVASIAAPKGCEVLPGNEAFVKNRPGLDDLCRRRFLYRQGSEIYGGVAGFYTYGPPGCAIKNNFLQQWRQHFVLEEQLMEIEDTCIMEHHPLKASGHVDRFNDFMVKDVKDESKFFRADKLLEDVMEKKIEEEKDQAKIEEYTKVKNQADGYSKEELMEIFEKYQIKSPESGNDLSEPYAFNLMFPTPIGPSGQLQGYLRPETAQGIFLNYKFCLEQNGSRLPFGISQIGKVFRNEIAPRAGLTRVREFSQCEIEWFVKPTEKDHPKFQEVAPLVLRLFPIAQQLDAEEPIWLTLGDAVAKGVVDNETLGYMIGRTYLFLRSIGIKEQHLRFRQHLPTEMAHYACDCWDAEIECCYGWLECVGIADRSCFDLNAHAAATKVDLSVKERIDPPLIYEAWQLTKKGQVSVMKAFKKQGKAVKEWMDEMDHKEFEKLIEDVRAKGSLECVVDCETTVTLLPEHVADVEKVTVKKNTESYIPSVVEPSFGVDRILFAMWEHAYYSRPAEEEGKKTIVPGVLRLPPSIAPYQVIMLPMDQRVSRDGKFREMVAQMKAGFTKLDIAYTFDDAASATLGKRYARNDELGIPFAVTVDLLSLEEDVPQATVRERDTMEQVRAPIADVPGVIRELVASITPWEQIKARYPGKIGR
mmetsp:Transcript_5110/g.11953  ORF Transcript_5110/g.11953 Transcript_5110/m.11953 type:complete len:655 (+) Transcript_5110:73-2037(+)